MDDAIRMDRSSFFAEFGCFSEIQQLELTLGAGTDMDLQSRSEFLSLRSTPKVNWSVNIETMG